MAKINMEQIARIYGGEHTAYWSGNKMSQVATMFGKKLGEEFDVRINGNLKCLKFDEQRGLLYFNGDEWRKNYAYLDWLVRGKAVIVDDDR